MDRTTRSEPEIARCSRCRRPLPTGRSDEECPSCLLALAADGEAVVTSGSQPVRPLRTLRYFGDYEIDAEIARGSMGVVYRARQVSLDRPVALKMILTGELAAPQGLQRFQIEAEAAARLDHQNIVSIFEIGEHDGQQYYSMKLVEGGSLAQRFTRGRGVASADRRAAVALMAKTARAVHYAHERGVLHRDLKPSNILVDAAGEPHVTDFGLARLAGDDGRVTRTESILGTPAYMAPELAAGHAKQSTIAVDVYSLGAILYELLAGRPPFRAESVLETLRQVAEVEPPRPRALDPTVDRDLETICLKCIEKSPEARYASAAKVADELERWLSGEPIHARPARPTERLWRWCRRNPIVAGLLAAVALLVVVIVAGSIVAATLYRAKSGIADVARAKAVEELYHSLLAQARTARLTGGDALGLVRRAKELLEPDPLDDARLHELRDEAIACLAAPSLRRIGGWRLPAGSSGGILGLDSRHERIFCLASDGSPVALRLADGALELRLKADGVPRFNYGDESVSEDGSTLVVTYATPGNAPDQTDVWDVERRALRFRVRSHGAAALSSDGRMVAVPDGALRVLDVATGAETFRAGADARCVALSGSPEPRRVAFWDASDRTLHLFDLDRREEVGSVRPELPILDLSFSPDGEWLAAGGADNLARVFDVPSMVVRSVSRGHESAIVRVAFDRGGELLMTESWDSTSRLWDPRSGQELVRFEGSCPGFSEDGRRLVVNHAEQGIGLFAISGTEVVRQFHPRGEPAPASPWRGTCSAGALDFDFSTDGRLLASAAIDGVRFWDPDRAAEVAHLDIGLTESIRFDPGGRGLWSYGEYGLFWWPIAPTSATPATLAIGPPEAVDAGGRIHPQRISFDRLGDTPVWVDRDRRQIASCETASRSPRATGMPCGGIQTVSSPDGRCLVVLGWKSGFCDVFDVERRAFAARLEGVDPHDWIDFAAFSPDGRVLITSNLREFEWWSTQSWTPIARLPRELQEPGKYHLALSPRGDVVALARTARAVDLVDVASARPIATLTLPRPQLIVALRFSEDGGRLAVSPPEGPFQVWDLRGVERELGELGLDQGLPRLASPGPSAPPPHLELRGAGLPQREFLDAQIRRAERLRRSWESRLFTKGALEAPAVRSELAAFTDYEPLVALRDPAVAEALPEPGRSRWRSLRRDFARWQAALAAGGTPPERPTNMTPADGATSIDAPVRLATAPASEADGTTSHRFTRWQVRREEGDFELDPVFDRLSTDELSFATLPDGLLLPQTAYVWRSARVAADGRCSSWSVETRFTTGDLAVEPVRFDLAEVFNRGVVFAAGGGSSGELDDEAGAPLHLDGRPFQGAREIGVHRLGDPCRFNSLQISASDRAPIRVAAPPRRYRSLRLLVTGGLRDAEVPIRLEYDDGRCEERIVRADALFDELPTRSAGVVAGDALPVRRGLDHFSSGELVPDGRGVLYEVIVATDPSRTLAAIVFEPMAPAARRNAGRFNLLALTGMSAAL